MELLPHSSFNHAGMDCIHCESITIMVENAIHQVFFTRRSCHVVIVVPFWHEITLPSKQRRLEIWNVHRTLAVIDGARLNSQRPNRLRLNGRVRLKVLHSNGHFRFFSPSVQKHKTLQLGTTAFTRRRAQLGDAASQSLQQNLCRLLF